MSEKYGLVYVITKLGLLFMYDLETGAAMNPPAPITSDKTTKKTKVVPTVRLT